MGRAATVRPTLDDALRRQERLTPETVALAVHGGGDLTYTSWYRRSRAVARGMAVHGVHPDDRVVLLFDNARWTDYAVAYAAVRAVGAVAVPLGPRPNALDVARVVRQCGPVLGVGPPDLAPPGVDVPFADLGSLEDRVGDGEVPGPRNPASGADLLVPSGAMRPLALHQRPADGGLASGFRVPPSAAAAERPVLVHAFPPGSELGQDALLLPLRQAATAVVAPAFEPERACALVVDRRATALGVPPYLARCLVDSGALGRHDMASVRCLLLGPGEPSSALVAALTRALPGVEVVVDAGGSLSVSGSQHGLDAAPLASSQDGMVWHEQFAPGSFNLAPLARRYRGRLDVGALEAALAEIVRRHDALRARFQVADGKCVQTFPTAGSESLPLSDLGGMGVGDQEAALAAALAEARNQPFDLVTGPLFEPRLLRLGVDDHVLLVRAHHSVFDDWSVGLFRRELSSLYTAFVAGEASPLPELPTTFAAACRRQRETIDGDRGAADRAFWAEELRGAPLSTELPLDDPARPEGSPHRAADPVTVTVPSDVVAALRQLARRERSTVFMVLLAGFVALVHRCQDADDVVLSSLAANRNRTELESIIGCFAKKVLLRVRIAGDPSFTELVSRTRAALMGAMAHQDLAYEAVLQDALGPDATAHGLAPQVSLKFQSAVLPTARLSLPGVTAGPLELRRRIDRPAHFLSGEGGGGGAAERPPWGCGIYSGTFLGLSVAETETELSLTAEGVFHPPAVARMLAQYRTLLAAIAADPSLPVSELEVLDAEQRAEIEAWRGATVEVPRDTFADLLAVMATRVPDRPAVVTGDGQLSYVELTTAARRLAARLRAAGAGPGTRVGVRLDRSPSVVVATVAVWLAGAAWVPVDGADHHRIDDPSGDQPLTAVIVDDASAADVAGSKIPVLEMGTTGSAAPADDASFPPAGATDEPACVLDGGRAGDRPIEVDHGAVVDLWVALQAAVYSGGEGLTVHAPGLGDPPAFLRAVVALLGGHTLHFGETATDGGAAGILDGLEEGRLDVVECSPTVLAGFVERGLHDALVHRRAGRPRPIVVLATSGPVPEPLWQRWRGLQGADGVCLYAPPGLPLVVAAGRLADLRARPTVGRAAANVACRVLDRRGRMVPFQVVGALHVGRSATATVDEASLRATGQLARLLPDGSLELLGETSQLADLRGFRVDLGRLEATLAGCPGVADVGTAVERYGHEGRRLVVAVVAAPDSPVPDLGHLRRSLWTQLPGYAWPARMVLVDAVPRGADGRLAPSALPAATSSNLEDPPVDKDPRELTLRAAWAEAEGAEVDAEANYWQSFSFLDALARVAEAGVPVGGRHVTRNRTVETLAVDLAADLAAEADDRRRATGPLSGAGS